MAIQGLWSPDEGQRERAKSEISLGGPAVEAELIRTLSELVEDQRPRYPTGKEAEGEAILYATFRGERPSRDHTALDDYIINRRLMLDIIDLLGRLKSEAAIPLLIRILEQREMDSLCPVERFWAVGPEMKALSRIGRPAVPALIAALDGARSAAEREENILIGWWAISQPSEEGEVAGAQREENWLDRWRGNFPSSEEGEVHGSSYGETEEEHQEDLEERASKIRLRAVMTLGRIRDRAALPVLKNLLDERSIGVRARRQEWLDPNVHSPVFDPGFTRDSSLVGALSDAVQAIEAGPDNPDRPDRAHQPEFPPGPVGGWVGTPHKSEWDD